MTTEQRLVKLERRCRILVGMLVLGAGLLSLAAAAPPSNQEELTVGKLTVIDKAGRKRIILSGDANGECCLGLLDPMGNVRVSLAATREDAGLLLFDSKQQNRAVFNTDKSGQGMLSLIDGAGSERVVLFTRNTQAGIALHGAQKEPSLTLINNGVNGLIGFGDITRDEGFIMGYDYQRRSGILKVGDQRLDTLRQ